MEVDMSDSMKALWSVQFATNGRKVRGGIVIFKDNQLFGGDSSYYYLGRYATLQGKIRGEAEAFHYAGPPSTIFGPLEHVRLTFEGQFNDSVMTLSGTRTGNPLQQIEIILTKRADLP
jgi:hypothetical protein